MEVRDHSVMSDSGVEYFSEGGGGAEGIPSFGKCDQVISSELSLVLMFMELVTSISRRVTEFG